MSVTNYDGRLEQWYINTASMKKILENSTDTVEMPAITNYDGMLEAIAETAGECLDVATNLVTAIKNNSLVINVDANAYNLKLSDIVYRFDGIKLLGGKTVAFNQLVNSGTTSVNTISGRKYYKFIDGTASIVSATGSAIDIVDDSSDMVIDLSLMFGKGNEPADVSEVQKIFPAAHYEYEPGTLVSADVTDVVSKNSEDETLQTLDVPAEVKALPGYGWSAGSVYNYIDYENKKFVQKVGVVDMGTITYTYSATAAAFGFGVSGSSNPATRNNVCGKYDAYNWFSGTTAVIANYPDKAIYRQIGTMSWFLKDSDYGPDDATALAADLSGVYLYYELATPVETDISEYLTDNITEASGAGTLTFENSNGTDYHLPVPVKAEYVGL